MGPDAQFRAFLLEGRFMIQRCADSKEAIFYPRMFSPGTGEVLEWIEASGRGTVYSTTVVRRRPPDPSYNVALIDLDEGPRMMSRVDGIAPGDVRIGMAVVAHIIIENDQPLVIFEVAE